MRVSKVLFILILTLSVFGCAKIAYAQDVGSGGGDFSDKVIYGPSVFNVAAQQYGIQTYSSNEFNAALTALGYDPYDSRFDADAKAYLSNASTGGSFYEFASGFTNNNNVDWGLNIYSISFASALGTNNSVYGSEFVWMRIYTQDLFDDAKQRVVDVLAGNVEGGSGGSGGSGGDNSEHVYTFDLENYIRVYSYGNQQGYITVGGVRYNLYDSGDVKSNFPSGNKITVTLDSRYDNLDLSDYTDAFICLKPINGYMQIDFYLFKPSTYTLSMDHVDNRIYTITTNGVDTYYWSQKSRVSLVYDSMPFDTTYVVNNLLSLSTSTQLVNFTPGLFSKANVSGPPPTNWPEPEPTTPTQPPTVPEPPEPTPPTEPPTVTVPTAPALPTPTYPTEPTYNNPDLSSILDAMQRHCVHLQECMHNCFEDYYDNITAYQKSLQEDNKEFFRSWFRVILDTIQDCFDDLNEYLEDLFHWLADQMDFNFSGNEYDDTSLLYWLKRIYAKLGGGTRVKPVDPVVDPTGTGDWLDELLKNLVNALLGFGQEALADVADMVRQLINKFPFSIPWDIAAILALLAAEPQTPVITIPQYALLSTGVAKVGDYVIDLQPYNGVMEAARNMEKLLFAFWLCWKIDFFKHILDGIGIGGSE